MFNPAQLASICTIEGVSYRSDWQSFAEAFDDFNATDSNQSKLRQGLRQPRYTVRASQRFTIGRRSDYLLAIDRDPEVLDSFGWARTGAITCLAVGTKLLNSADELRNQAKRLRTLQTHVCSRGDLQADMGLGTAKR